MRARRNAVGRFVARRRGNCGARIGAVTAGTGVRSDLLFLFLPAMITMYPKDRAKFRWEALLSVTKDEHERVQREGAVQLPDTKAAPMPVIRTQDVVNVDMENEEVEFWFGKVSFSGREVAKHLQQCSGSGTDNNGMGKRMMKALKAVQDGKPLKFKEEILWHVNSTNPRARNHDSDLETSDMSEELGPPIRRARAARVASRRDADTVTAPRPRI